MDTLLRNELTLAACVMPDHLHWLVLDGRDIAVTVASFKSFTTHLGWRFGVKGRLWQRSFFDHIVRAEEDLRAVAEYIVANPVRAGLVRSIDEYPFQVLLRDRFPT